MTLHCAVQADERSIQSNENNGVHIDDLLKQYPNQFDCIGNFHGEYHIVTDPQVQPVIHAPRKCPIQLKDEIKNCLDEMVENGVIRKVDEPTDWVNSLAYSRKQNGKLRICLDPKDLNMAIKRCHHHTPTLEEITHQFAESQHFSKLDAKNGYWSVKLDAESQLLQFAFWKVLLPSYALLTSDVPRHFPATDGPDHGEMPRNSWNRG